MERRQCCTSVSSRSTDAQDRDRGAPSYIDPPWPRTAAGPASLRVPRRRPEMPNQRFDVVVQGPKMEIFDHPDDCSVVVPGHDKLLADGVLQTEPSDERLVHQEGTRLYPPCAQPTPPPPPSEIELLATRVRVAISGLGLSCTVGLNGGREPAKSLRWCRTSPVSSLLFWPGPGVCP